ncbi:hypothetical protein PRIPAC_78420, partial [Pristionchus pacificus]|uniref:Uncharacterized protein n=1 Tax=Pristionchus pacificus TaxID=54126 RepID=A0A2A6BXQ0_PRIPA
MITVEYLHGFIIIFVHLLVRSSSDRVHFSNVAEGVLIRDRSGCAHEGFELGVERHLQQPVASAAPPPLPVAALAVITPGASEPFSVPEAVSALLGSVEASRPSPILTPGARGDEEMMVEADELTGCEDDVVDELRGESLKATDAPDREESLAVDASSSMGASSSSDGCSRAEVSSKDSAAVLLWCPESTWNQVEMGFQVGIKYSAPAPFPQVGIKQAYVPAVSSTHVAYKSYPDCLRARVRSIAYGTQFKKMLHYEILTEMLNRERIAYLWGRCGARNSGAESALLSIDCCVDSYGSTSTERPIET